MRIAIDDFRRMSKARFETQLPVNLLIGENQAGKSSVLGAVEVALTGDHSEWLQRRGESLSDLRRGDAKKAFIGVGLADPRDQDAEIAIERVLTGGSPKLAVTRHISDRETGEPVEVPWLGTVTEQQKDLLAHFGMTADQLACCLNGGQFPDLDAKAQTAFLASLSGAELNVQELGEKLAVDNQRAYKLFKDHLVGDFSGAALLDGCEKIVRKRRTEVKGERDRVEGVLEEARVGAARTQPEGEEPEAPEAALAALDDRVQNAEWAARDIERADAAVATAREAVETAGQALTKAQEADKAAPRDELAAEDAKVEGQERQVKAAEEVARKALADLTEAREAQERVRCYVEDLQGALASDGAECERCHQIISGDLLRKLLAQAVDAEAVSDAKHKELGERYAALKEQVEQALDAQFATHKERGRLRELCGQVDETIETAKHLQADCAEQLTAAEAARKNLADPEDTSGIAAEVDALTAWADYSTAKVAIAQHAENLVKAEAQVELWEWLVAKFGSGPDSYRAELLGGGLAGLEAAVNRALEPLTGEQIVFPKGDSGLRVQGLGMTHPTVPMYLSGSEALRLQIALQYAFCRVLDFPLILIDCEAALDPNTKAAILALCREIGEEWPEVTILLAMVPTRKKWREELEPETFKGWAQVWEVTKGTVKSVLGPESPFDKPAELPAELEEEQPELALTE